MSRVELSESLEDYLIAIADLASDGQPVHSGSVADRVGVSTASVTHAFRSLRNHGLINYRRYQAVRLTDAGTAAADAVLHRKRLLLRFFREVLELDDEEAERNAHRMEHVISPLALERLSVLVEGYPRKT